MTIGRTKAEAVVKDVLAPKAVGDVLKALASDGFGHCTCMARLGEVCSHVGAILYTLQAAVNKLHSTTCTDEACAWNEPSVAARRKMECTEGSKIVFSKAQSQRAADGSGDLPPVEIHLHLLLSVQGCTTCYTFP